MQELPSARIALLSRQTNDGRGRRERRRPNRGIGQQRTVQRQAFLVEQEAVGYSGGFEHQFDLIGRIRLCGGCFIVIDTEQPHILFCEQVEPRMARLKER